MRKFYRLGLAGVVAASASLSALIAWPIGQPPTPITLQGNVERGAYLARASGCIACHTNIASRGAPLAGGLRLETPFGALYSPNLTTDPDHGIGSWTQAQFARAVREGVSPEGTPITRPLPTRSMRTSRIKRSPISGLRSRQYPPSPSRRAHPKCSFLSTSVGA